MDLDKPVLEIDIGVIRQNYRTLCRIASRSIVSAVIKSDCYGLGSYEIVTALAAEGCKHFFTANIEEAIAVQKILSDKTLNNIFNIYILNGVFKNTAQAILSNNLIPVLNNRAQLELWSLVASKENKKLPAILHLDSGMKRLGISTDDVKAIFSEQHMLKKIDVQMVMSHLSSSEEPQNNENTKQLKEFLKLCKYIPDVNYSIANSGGIFLGKEFHLNLVRPGAAIYGLYTHPEAHKYIQNPIKLTAPIIQLQKVNIGEKIGYNVPHVASKPMYIATLPLGYADGFFRSQRKEGKMYIDGTCARVVGNVSMDLVTLDVSHIPQDSLYLGKHVEIIGKHQTPDQLAINSDTIGYEIITSLGKRFKRVYTNQG